MNKASGVCLSVAVVLLGTAGRIGFAQRPVTPATPASQSSAPRATPQKAPVPVISHATNPAAAEQNAVIKRYCVTCHTEARKPGGLSLASFDVARAAESAEVAERVIRKLRAGMMPPPGSARPDAATQQAILASLETTIDAGASAKPNP